MAKTGRTHIDTAQCTQMRLWGALQSFGMKNGELQLFRFIQGPLAVTSFNRYSRLAESLGRRLTYSLVSMYFDDASIVDWSSSKGSSQAAFSALNKMLGTPFAIDKQQLMSSRGTFLGLEHDLSSAIPQARSHFGYVIDFKKNYLTCLTPPSNQPSSHQVLLPRFTA